MRKRGPRPRGKEIVWNEEISYAVGLMASDGCLSPDGRHLLFTSKDLEQVSNIKRIFSVRASIRQISPRNSRNYYYRLQWGDVRLYAFLQGIGVTRNKSLSLGEVLIPDEYFFDFLRGVYDGDGCFYSYFDPRWENSYLFYFCFASASKGHLAWIQESLNKRLGIQGSLATNTQFGKRNAFYQLKYAKKETLQLLKQIYPSEEVVALSRKRLKIDDALRIVGLSLSSL